MRVFLLLLPWMLASHLALAAQTRVATDIGFSGVRIEASSHVEADPATLWATLTDYNNLARFVPGMTLSRQLPTQRPGVKLVEQRGEGGVLAMLLPDHVIFAVSEQAPHVLKFHAVSGQVMSMQGEWQIRGAQKPVQLVYRAHIVPLLPPPPTLTDWYVESEIRTRMDAVVREAERRMKVK